jgi:hypothetical protein
VRTMLILALAVAPLTSSSGQSLGDEVAACLGARNVKPLSPGFEKALRLCEIEVEAKRQMQIQALEGTKEAWGKCLISQIAALDDGISTASDVATAVQDTCEPEYIAVVDSLDLQPADWDTAYQQRREATKEASTGLVLIVRAARSAAHRREMTWF